MFRLLVTGSRGWEDELSIPYTIAFLCPTPAVLVEGGARGLDRMFRRLWLPYGPIESYPVTGADWDQYGQNAGHRRNKIMVDTSPNVCVAFIKNGSAGASGCRDMAVAAGIPTWVWRQDGSGVYGPVAG